MPALARAAPRRVRARQRPKRTTRRRNCPARRAPVARAAALRPRARSAPAPTPRRRRAGLGAAGERRERRLDTPDRAGHLRTTSRPPRAPLLARSGAPHERDDGHGHREDGEAGDGPAARLLNRQLALRRRVARRPRLLPSPSRRPPTRSRCSSAPGSWRRTRRSTCTSTRSGSSPTWPRYGAPPAGSGQVQAGQYSGYLFPMGPFFALGHASSGWPPWLVQRLWLGTLLALAAWGTVRLLDALLDRRGAPPTSWPGRLCCSTPTWSSSPTAPASRCSATRRCRGCCSPCTAACASRGGWWWAAPSRCVVASTGGGVNAAVTAWVLLGPAAAAGLRGGLRRASRRAALGFCLRAPPRPSLASLWWIVPVARMPATGSTSCPSRSRPGRSGTPPASARACALMGYWITYLGVGYGRALSPYFDTPGTLLSTRSVVLATLRSSPRWRSAGFAWTRRWRYGPFFLALVLVGAARDDARASPRARRCAGRSPSSTTDVEAVQFLRTTYKAAPLVALGAGLPGGVAAGELRGAPGRAPAARCARSPALAASLLALTALAAAPGPRRSTSRWSTTFRAHGRARRPTSTATLPRGTRALVLPGQVFPFYAWGGTQDPILPALTDGPWRVRGVVPYSDLHAADLLLATDALVQQRRLMPGQLAPLLDLMGAGAVVTGTDDDRVRSGSVGPGGRGGAAGRTGLTGPRSATGRGAVHAAPATSAPATLPQVRRYDARERPRRSYASSRRTPARWWTAPRRRSPGWRRSARCPRRPAARLRRRPDAPRAARGGRRRGGGRGERLQPPAGVRVLAAAAEHGADPAAATSRLRGRRGAEPVPRRGTGSPDRGPARGRALDPRALLAAASRSSPSTAPTRRSTATPGPTGWPTATSSATAAGSRSPSTRPRDVP